ncbi:hypothetical protein PF007_g3719 [Phytophthora fragariae]|uniref:Uncharacterized protein n=4 Tax=Phytophthora TaxID=4783 RepID=A0A6A4DVQ4_9STRA|nr:hypothetical protein PF007_g3719 [Phytophthora fragariae]KAE9312000.1 hypothetical protein PR003_g19870 [Phytophthora rubi]
MEYNQGSSGKANIEFHPDAVYKFRQVDGVGYYADIAKGSVQYDNTDKVVELEPPLKKRKLQMTPKTSKGKSHALEPTEDSDDTLAFAMDVEPTESVSKEGEGRAVTTRSKRGDQLHPCAKLA